MPPLPARPSRSSAALCAAATGHGAGAVIGVLGGVAVASRSIVTVVALVAGVLLVLVSAKRPRPQLAPMSVFMAGSALAVIGVTPPGAITIVAAVLLGTSVGAALPVVEWGNRVAFAGGVVAIIELLVAAALFGSTAAIRWSFVLVVVAGLIAFLDRGRTGTAPSGRAAMAVGVVAAIALLAWVAGNDPTVEWFGHITTHGDRHGNEVALTFDDGPDSQWTMATARLLDDHGVKGTFFEVGRAIDARPDITKALYADGHLLGNHSYRHDYTGWLDPGYPELGETQAAFARALGVCPALFRPPHGQRTPFMLAHVTDRGMDTVTWDVSASDWTERDGHVVAQRILDHVRPGSIILLHDGLDGKVMADRSVLATALPEILDGLAAKGLHPVRLDQLLGVEPYLAHC